MSALSVRDIVRESSSGLIGIVISSEERWCNIYWQTGCYEGGHPKYAGVTKIKRIPRSFFKWLFGDKLQELRLRKHLFDHMTDEEMKRFMNYEL